MPNLAKLLEFCTVPRSQTPTTTVRNKTDRCKSQEVLPRKTCFNTRGKSAKPQASQVVLDLNAPANTKNRAPNFNAEIAETQRAAEEHEKKLKL